MTEDEAFCEELISKIKNASPNVLSVLDKKRYNEAIDSVNKIIAFAKSNYPDTEVSLEFDKTFGTSLMLILRAQAFEIIDIVEFCSALKSANTMSVYPVDEDTVEVGFTFEKIKKLYDTPKNKELKKQAK